MAPAFFVRAEFQREISSFLKISQNLSFFPYFCLTAQFLML